MMREMIQRHMKNEVRFRYILADSWYSSTENMKFIEKMHKVFIFGMKGNRHVAESKE
jgi:hypothetical protein